MDDLSNELNKLRIDKSKRIQPRTPSHRGRWAALAVVMIAGAVAFFALRKTGAATTVETVRPRLESSSQSAVLVATGYVIAHHKIQVGSKIMGRVAWIGVEKGDRVRQGQVVVRLDDREYRAQFEQAKASYDAVQARLRELEQGSRPEEIERARADVDRAQADLRTAEAQFRRIEGLVKEGVSPAQALDEAKGRYESAAATLASVTKTYELIRQGPRREQIENARSEVQRAKASVDYARTILDAAEIRVPSDGTILERNVEQGEMVTTSFVGDQGAKGFVVTLADLNDIQVELDINQNDFNRIRPKQPCTVVTDAYPDRVYKCRVDEIAPEANRQKATIQVKVKFDEPDEYVRPDMNARVTFLQSEDLSQQTKGESSLYVVPKRAIVERESGKAVLVVSDGKVQVKPVTIDKEVGSDVFVSGGLVGGEAIIVGEQLARLQVGDRVEVNR
jgi:HlyD family secretion protein